MTWWSYIISQSKHTGKVIPHIAVKGTGHFGQCTTPLNFSYPSYIVSQKLNLWMVTIECWMPWYAFISRSDPDPQQLYLHKHPCSAPDYETACKKWKWLAIMIRSGNLQFLLPVRMACTRYATVSLLPVVLLMSYFVCHAWLPLPAVGCLVTCLVLWPVRVRLSRICWHSVCTARQNSPEPYESPASQLHFTYALERIQSSCHRAVFCSTWSNVLWSSANDIGLQGLRQR